MTDEKILIQNIQAGDRFAFRTLVEEYKQIVYTICYRLTGNHTDADDLAQTVFIKFFKSIKSFRHESAIKSWLYKIAVNSYIDIKRKKMDQITDFFEAEGNSMQENVKSNKAAPDTNAASEMIKLHIEKALNLLSPKEKTVFVLKHYQEHTIKEIAKTINTTEGTVKSLLFRGVKKMQKALAFYKPELGLKE